MYKAARSTVHRSGMYYQDDDDDVSRDIKLSYTTRLKSNYLKLTEIKKQSTTKNKKRKITVVKF